MVGQGFILLEFYSNTLCVRNLSNEKYFNCHKEEIGLSFFILPEYREDTRIPYFGTKI